MNITITYHRSADHDADILYTKAQDRLLEQDLAFDTTIGCYGAAGRDGEVGFVITDDEGYAELLYEGLLPVAWMRENAKSAA